MLLEVWDPQVHLAKFSQTKLGFDQCILPSQAPHLSCQHPISSSNPATEMMLPDYMVYHEDDSSVVLWLSVHRAT